MIQGRRISGYLARIPLWGALLPLMFLSQACMRPLTELSRTRLDLSKLSSVEKMQNLQPVYLVIEAKAPDFMPGRRFVWTAGRSGATPPTSIYLDVPKGSSRLFQVFAVYEDGDNGNALLFSYGDATKNLVGADESVTVTLSKLNDPAATMEGRVSGRYLTEANKGPTGILNAFYTPTNRPGMLLFTHEIYAGWFSLQAFSPLKLSYRMGTGELLFGGARNLDDLATGSSKLWVELPVHYKEDSASLAVEARPAQGQILGFFGPAAAGTVCLDDGGVAELIFERLYTTAAKTTALSFKADRTGLVQAGGDAICTGTAFVDYLSFNMEEFSWGNDSGALGFQGPFKAVGTEGFLAVSGGASGLDFGWAYLPGVSSALTAVELWMRPSNTARDYELHGPAVGLACHRLGELGFSKVAQLGPTVTSHASTIADPGSGVAIACPIVGTRTGRSGVAANSDEAGASQPIALPAYFTVSGITDPVVAGTAEKVTVTAYNDQNAVMTDYMGTITFSSDDPAAILPPDYTFTAGDGGTMTFNAAVRLNTTGLYYVQVADTTDPTVIGQQTAIDVTPSALSHFGVAGISNPATSAIAETVTITAYDTQNNIKTDYLGTITFSSSDAAATLPVNYTFTAANSGVATFTNGVVLNTAGTQNVKAEDAGDATKSGFQTSITVNPGALNSFTIIGVNDPTTAGAAHSPTVTAYDAQGNVKTNYVGTIRFSSDDAASTLPADYSFVVGDSGSKTFTNGVVLNTVGIYYLKVEDAANATLVGQRSNIDVTPGALSYFTVAGITDPTVAGVAEAVTVTAYDAQNNVKTDYLGTIAFYSSDAAATLPANYTFTAADSGAVTLVGGVTLKTTGVQYVKVKDTLDATKLGQQSNIDVGSAAMSYFTVTGITNPTMAGQAETPSVTARDAYGNIKTDYVGTIRFSSDEATALLPADYTFLAADNGVKAFTGGVSMNITGTYYVRVEDTVDATLFGQQSSIVVNPGALSHFLLTGIANPTTAGTAETVTVTAYDDSGNIKTDYVGTVTFTSDDTAATLPADYAFLLGDSGTKTFTTSVVLQTTGTYYVKVEDTLDATKVGQQSSISVNPGPLSHFVVSGIPSMTNVGTVHSAMVTAHDQFGNIKTDYLGTITFSSDDTTATLPPDYTYVAGDLGGANVPGVSFGSTGTFYLMVEEFGFPMYSGQLPGITVNP